MRLTWKAFQAVSVEMIGVVAVLWLLFGVAGWTTRSRPAAATRVSPAPPAAAAAAQRVEYTGARLDHYSRQYRHAASGFLSSLATEFLATEVTETTEENGSWGKS